MTDTEKQIAASILKKIEETGSGEEIANYHRFLESVALRKAIDDPSRRF